MILPKNIFTGVVDFSEASESVKVVSRDFGQIDELENARICFIAFDGFRPRNIISSRSSNGRSNVTSSDQSMFFSLVDRSGFKFINNCPVALFSFPEVHGGASIRGINFLFWKFPRFVSWSDSFISTVNDGTLNGSLNFTVGYD